MTILIDANVLLRFIQTTSSQHLEAVTAIAKLNDQGHTLNIVPQSLYEFWVAATRPLANNGLELSLAECDQTIDGFLKAFPLLEDPAGLFTNWRALTLAPITFIGS